MLSSESQETKAVRINISNVMGFFFSLQLDRYADVNALSLMTHNLTCLSHKYKKYIQDLKKTGYDSAAESG